MASLVANSRIFGVLQTAFGEQDTGLWCTCERWRQGPRPWNQPVAEGDSAEPGVLGILLMKWAIDVMVCLLEILLFSEGCLVPGFSWGPETATQGSKSVPRWEMGLYFSR